MYLFHDVDHRDRMAGFHGLHDTPADAEQFDKSRAAIQAALALNPKAGYVKGSLARQQLEQGFESVPITRAQELLDQLSATADPLGRSFRYRLHTATQLTMRAILERKSVEQQRKLLEAQQNLERVCRETAPQVANVRARIDDFDKALERICKAFGEDSDQCQELRFKALELHETVREMLRRRKIQCP